MADEKSIEVTPEMITAGARKISEEWIGFTTEESTSSLWATVLTEVFLAMLEAQPKSDRTEKKTHQGTYSVVDK